MEKHPSLLAICLSLTFWLLVADGPAQFIPGLATIENFEGDSPQVTLGRNSHGTIQIMPGAGYEGSRGLVFSSGAAQGRVSATIPVVYDQSKGVIFWGKSGSGNASIWIRLIEPDGDQYVASVGLTSRWRVYGIPFSRFEFLRDSDGSRSPDEIRHLVIEAVLTGNDREKVCVIDNLGMASAIEAESVWPWDWYLNTLCQAAQEALNHEPTRAQLIVSRLRTPPETPFVKQKETFERNFDSFLDEALQQAGDLSDLYEQMGPGLESSAGRKAERQQAMAETYYASLSESRRRHLDYGLTFPEIEQALAHAKRMLGFYSSAVKLLRTPQAAIAPPPVKRTTAKHSGKARRVRLLLNGDWQASFPSTMDAAPAGGWVGFPVPHGVWGKTLRANFDVPAEVDPKSPYAWFRRSVSIPSDWQGGTTELRFLGAGHYVEVHVNGRYCGSHLGGFDPFSIDVSSAVLPGGSNEVVVLTADSSISAAGVLDPFVEKGAYAGVSPGPGPNFALTMGGADGVNAGIWDDVVLTHTSGALLDGVRITTSVRENRIAAQVSINSLGREIGKAKLKAAVFDGNEIILTLPEIEIDLSSDSSRPVTIESDWSDYEPWGPDAPYGSPKLYWLRLSIEADGAVLDERTVRFGFREFGIHSSGFFLNGHRIRLQCDTISASTEGGGWERANPWYFTQYLELARVANVNCVILREPFPGSWIGLCDEAGMLCIPHTPVRGMVSCAPPDLFGLDDYTDPLWLKNAKRQLSGWTESHLNHPSVAARVTESGSFSEDLFWIQGQGVPSQARKTRERLHAAMALDKVVRKTDSSLPVLHLDSRFADADPRFKIRAWSAPFDATEWRRLAHGRPLVAGIRIPVGHKAIPPLSALNSVNPNDAEYALELITDWTYDSAEELANHDVSGIVLPGLRAGLSTTARPELKGPWAGAAEPVRIEWPSLSGPGMRARHFNPPDGRSARINWFDQSLPAATPNSLFSAPRTAFVPSGGLGGRVSTEVLLRLSGGTSDAEKPVLLTPADAIGGESLGTIADHEGTAWIALPRPGQYATNGGQTIEVSPLPRETSPGFSHIPEATIHTP